VAAATLPRDFVVCLHLPTSQKIGRRNSIVQ
jgi:hypothetical protein